MAQPSRHPRGFTLLELMVVVAIIALATAGVSFSLRDSGERQLETEALRLSAMLESARAQSRSSGVPVRWRATAAGFEFNGLPSRAKGADSLAGAHLWLNTETVARITRPADAGDLLLGPEPLIPAQRLDIGLGERRLSLATDGLSPFTVSTGAGAP